MMIIQENGEIISLVTPSLYKALLIVTHETDKRLPLEGLENIESFDDFAKYSHTSL